MRRLRSAAALSAQEWAVVIEAFVLTPLAAVAIRSLRLDRVVGLFARGRVRAADVDGPSPLRTAALVDHVASCMFARCLVKAVVLHGVLRRRGVDSAVVLGLATGASTLGAHAWLEHGGRVLLGAGIVPHSPLCRFGAGSRTGAAT
jgi:Transglutaminase-like superfamily